jgi:peptidoglycan hydrolase-like protein with peptidoglycan-binding domain
MRIALVVVSLFVVLLAGCTTAHRKHESQPKESAYRSDYPQSETQLKEEVATWSPSLSLSDTTSSPVIKLSARQIQRTLKNAGYYQGSIDGKIGSKTKEAIIKFQKAHGLKPDGIVGKKTAMALNTYLVK